MTENDSLDTSNQTTRANIERIRERISALAKSGVTNFEIELPESHQENGGAFKLYKIDSNEALSNSMKAPENLKPNPSPQQSPFMSIETTQSKQKQPASGKKTTRGPIRKYRSGSTSALNVKPTGVKKGREQLLEDKKALMQPQRPATQNDVLYAVESDESTIVDNLISDPQRLKEKLKQGKIDREQLSQLQENYLRLLEQYAEAENYIDTFRLSGHHIVGTNETPNLKMFQVGSN